MLLLHSLPPVKFRKATQGTFLSLTLPRSLDFSLKTVPEAQDDGHDARYGFLEGSVLEGPSTLLINHLNEKMETAFITEKYF